MKTIIVICLYDRYENLKKWLHSWNQCDKFGAKLFIVHNTEEEDTSYWKEYCEKNGAFYIKRQNIGFETGVIQDVLLGRMFKEENWDVLISATDDTLPMTPNFVQIYVTEVMQEGVGVACMEMSGVFTPHIRTTGFAINKETAKRIVFTTSQIKTKEECYFFEHQGGEFTLLSQVLKMKKLVVQISQIKYSVMWDTHHNAYMDRWHEWNNAFPGYEK